jgi:response regulator RpfG family c-di-GMP phosphodiesterase
MDEKILFVDDDANLLAAMERNFRKRFTLDTAPDGEAGLARIAQHGPYAVVVSDRQMPNMDGIQFLAAVRQRAPDSVRIMLTGNVDLEQAVRTVNEGNIFRFLIKPCPVEVVGKALEDAQAQYRLVLAERELLHKTLSGSVKLLTDILSITDAASFGRAQSLRDVISHVTKIFQPGSDWEIQLAAMLAAMGDIAIPPETLLRSRAGEVLSEVEEQIVKNAPATAARLLSNIPRLEGVAQAVRYQHKQYDGKGFPPDSVKGEAIPFGARLLKILSDLSQLEAKGVARGKALNEMESRRGWYDPSLLEAVRAFYGLTVDARDTTRPTICVTLADLAPGMVLRSDVETVAGMLILSTGHRLNEMTIVKIRNFHRLANIKEPISVEVPEERTPAHAGP